MITRRRGKRLLAIVAVVILSLCAGVETAFATGPDFSMLQSSVRPGFSILVSENDPCPSGITDQYFEVTITASNSATETSMGTVAMDGHWDYSVMLFVPLNAAAGTATVTARCYQWPSYNTTLQYASKQFTVSGSAATMSLPRTTVGRGETVRASSSEDCPYQSGGWVSTMVELLDSNGYNVHNFYTEAELDGDWNFAGDIPDGISAGTYKLALTCWSEAGGIRYTPVQIQVVDPPGFVALGDSFSAGEGAGTYFTNSGGCHRSPSAYPPYVATQKNINLYAFKACSGARTADFYGFNPGNSAEMPQRDWLTGTTDRVTLTMGGNDAGFANVMNTCAEYPGHSGWGCKYNYSMVSDLYALAGSGSANGDDGRPVKPLKQMYMDIAAEAPNATIYVGGYPKIFGSSTSNFSSNSSAPSGRTCNLAFSVSIDYDDAQWLGQVADDLNTAIESAVLSANADGANVQFVPVVSVFAGHGLCDSGAAWFNPVLLTSTLPPTATPESMHPTSTGYAQGYGAAFVSAM